MGGCGASACQELLSEQQLRAMCGVQEWAGALAAIGNANPFVLNASWPPDVSVARQAALQAALTGA
jgi:hypothetical protein